MTRRNGHFEDQLSENPLARQGDFSRINPDISVTFDGDDPAKAGGGSPGERMAPQQARATGDGGDIPTGTRRCATGD
jgi:hypothetical protein